MAAFTTLQQSSLVQLYVGILGTTPTTAALNTYATIFASTSGTDAQKYDAVAAAMVASTAGQTKYPVFATAGQIADTMLGHLGLPGTAVGADGTSLKALAEGILSYPGVTVASFARALLNALNTNTFSGTDALSVAAAAAKTAYGVSSTGVAGTTLKTAVDIALGVTPAVVDPVTRSFTTAADDLVGGAGNDTFTGSMLASSSPVANGDKITGAAGTDTADLKLIDPAGATLTLETSGVENINLSLFSAATVSGALWDSAVQKVVSSGLAGKALTVNNLSKAINFEVTDPSLGAIAGAAVPRNLSASFIDLSGASDSVSVTVNNTSASAITLDSNAGVIETLNVTFNQASTGASITLNGTGISGTTALTLNTGAADATVTVGNASSPVSTSGNVKSFTMVGTGSANSVNLVSTGTGMESIVLTSGNDTLAVAMRGAATGTSTIDAGAGNDTLTFSSTSSGTAVVTLGAGNDALTIGLAGAHSVSGGDGNDTISITLGRNHTVDGGDGNDRITINGSGSGNVVVTGGTGADTISIAVAGQHSILGGADADTIVGGSFVGTDDTIDGGAGADRISFTLAQSTNAMKLTDIEHLDVTFANGGIRRLDMTSVTGASTIELDGSGAAAYITNASGSLTLLATDGKYTGTNTLNFKDGANGIVTLSYSGASSSTVSLDEVQQVTISPRDGTSNVTSSLTVNLDETDTTTVVVNGASGLNQITLGNFTATQSLTVNGNGSGTLTVTANASARSLTSVNVTGSSADITINGLTGASGLATLTANAAVAGSSITIADVGGDNAFTGPSMSLSVASGASISIGRFDVDSVVESTLTITASGSGNSINFGTNGTADTAIGDEFYSTVSISGDVNFLMGTAVASKVMTSAGTAVRITGGSGNDRLYGTLSADTLTGGAGNDTMIGGSGADLFVMGAGADSIIGGSANDVYKFDMTITNHGQDKIEGFASTETINITGAGTNVIGFSAISSYAGGSAATSFFYSAGQMNLIHISGKQAVLNSSVDFYSANGFGALFSGSSIAGSANTSGIFSSSVVSLGNVDSGYGVGLRGVSSMSAVISVEVSGGSTFVVMLDTAQTGTQTLTTANIVGVIELTGFTGMATSFFG